MSKGRLTREEAEASLAAYQAKHPGQTHVRKAYAALGDDTTFSRFVRTGVRRERVVTPMQPSLGNLRHRAFEEGRPFFGAKDPSELRNLLVSGHANIKLGRDVRRGKLFRGYWIYALTLEERRTCPRSCLNWTTCYGNNMPYAHRIRVTQTNKREFEKRLADEVARLLAVRGRAGVLVRLHALGDFYDEQYVEFWGNLLARHDNLACFGYTARRANDQIGAEILTQKRVWGRRFAIRWSDGGFGADCTHSIRHVHERPAHAFICPEQLDRVDGCGKCGLCWNTDKDVAFLEH